jgi:hypothetical protein
MGPGGSFSCSQELFTGTCPQARSIQSVPPRQQDPSTYVMAFLVVSLLLAFPPVPYMHSSSSHSCYMFCPSQPPSLDHSNYILRQAQALNHLIMQFSQISVTSPLYSSNMLLNTLFSNTLESILFLNVRDQFSHRDRTTGKIVILYTLICMFLDSRRDDKSFWAKC